MVFAFLSWHVGSPDTASTQAVALIDPESERLPELPYQAYRDNELGDLVNGINDLFGCRQRPKQRRALWSATCRPTNAIWRPKSECTSDPQELNERLATERNLAEKANHEKGRFLAAASHDLRQLLQTLE